MFKLAFNENINLKEFEKLVDLEMDPHIKHLERELLKIRTGRAHPSMVEDIKANCYGTMLPLRDLAAISAPDVQLLVIQPWDKTLIPEIEKAISTSDLGAAPANDGNLIRIPLPKMSSSRREELSKTLGKKLEEAKINIRNVRKDVHNLIREADKGKKISEDLSRRLQDLLQKVTDKYTEQADKIAIKKEEEIKSL